MLLAPAGAEFADLRTPSVNILVTVCVCATFSQSLAATTDLCEPPADEFKPNTLNTRNVTCREQFLKWRRGLTRFFFFLF